MARTKKPTVWISDAMASPTNNRAFDSDILLENEKQGLSAMLRNQEGEPLAAEHFPKEMYSEYRNKKEKKQPHLFLAGGARTVSGECAAVLRNFDLGDGNLYPVKLFLHDRITPVEGEYFCINFGNQKTAVLTSESRNIARPYPDYDIWQPPMVMKDNDIAVSAAALDGPDIWVDTVMRDAFFVSDALARALRDAKVSRPFSLRKCIVI